MLYRLIKDEFIIELDDHIRTFVEIKGQGAIPISPGLIALEAKKFANEHGKLDLKFTSGWFQKLKKRINLRLGRIRGESNGVDKEKVESYRLNEVSRMLLNWQSEFIYNCDETGLFWRRLPRKTYYIKGKSVYGDKVSKERVSILFCCNRDGDKVSPLIIGKSKRPRVFKGKKAILDSLDIGYTANANAWVTRTIFHDWLEIFNELLEKDGKKILLTMDNFSGHYVNSDDFPNISFHFFPPNTTSHLQPLDSGIIRSFKSKYATKLTNKLIQNSIATSLEEIIKSFNLFDAVKWIDESWKEVTKLTITNCWLHSEGLPGEREKETISQNEENGTNLNTNLSLITKRFNSVQICSTNEYLSILDHDNIETVMIDC